MMAALLLVFVTFGGHVLGNKSPRLRCPLTCLCTGNFTNVSVVCRSYLTETPRFPIGTRMIQMYQNNITRIHSGAFSGLHQLTMMRIVKNNIRSIDKRTFEGLASLETLHLCESRLSSFESGLFRFFTNLTSLTMSLELDVPQTDICFLKHLHVLHLTLFYFPVAIFHPCFKELTTLRTLSLSFMKLEHSNISRATFSPLQASLTRLEITNCRLRRLPVDMFKDLAKLAVLDLGQNAITSLPNDIFVNLTHLIQLTISGNKFKVISDELLRPLQYLVNLYIGENFRLHLTLGEQFLNMTRLVRLGLSGIKLTSLNNETFHQLRHSPLVDVNMKGCHLQTINKGAFRPLRNLTVLSLDENQLNASVLHDAFYGLQGAPVHELHLSDVNLRDLSPTLFLALNHSDITRVSLKHSRITSIKRGVLCNLRQVTMLDMRDNKITTIEDHSFDDLFRLSELNLQKNSIVELKSAKRLGISSGLSMLRVDDNSIKKITQESLIGYSNLMLLYLDGNNIGTISPNAFTPTPRLDVLHLSRNKIAYIRPGTFDTLPNLRVLLLDRNTIQINNPSIFQRLQRLNRLDISENSFFGRLPSTLRSVFQNMPSLNILNLNLCGIETLPVGMFTNTTQLTTLGLGRNAIKSWNPDVFAPLSHLQLLSLARNNIVSVNVASFSHLKSLRQINLAQNPFVCNCDLMWFLDYVQNNNIFVNNIGSASSYTCSSPESLHGVPILRAGLSPADCVSYTDLVVALSTAAAIALSAIVFALVYRGRWYIRYYVFLIRSRRRRYFDLAEGSYVYDAFVAHNSNDSSWVVRHLLPRLEAEGRYRLCLHQRDWPIGREISENIVESIEASRKVIVVLSNNFAQSQWCRMELEMANHRRLSNWRNSLVLVLLETIWPENQTATLRNLLTTHTYLEWNERAEEKFWRALRKALRPPAGAPPIQMRSVQGGGRER